MQLLCYLHPGWSPRIRPAPATRAWMDDTPEAFAYRCLPLNIANAHGWEVLCPVDAEAYWTGGSGTGDVVVQQLGGATADAGGPVSLFGQGTLTFHVQGLFRTPPGWDLWISGPPNQPKDGIAPLSAVVETDWAPYTFTMNWKFTRRNHRIRFRADEPMCFLFPVRRGLLEQVEPILVPLESDPALMAQFRSWSCSRAQFQAQVAANPPAAPADKWQKSYYRGEPMPGGTPPVGHRARLRLRPFAPGAPAPPQSRVELSEDALGRLLALAADGGRGLQQGLVAAGIAPAVAGRLAERAADHEAAQA